MTRTMFRAWAGCLLVPMFVALTGCGQETPKAAPTDKVAVAARKADDHSHWWCAEHGIPEEECSMCSAKVAKACKASGDWCEKHDRAKSQCFVCDPSLKEKFAAKYRAKYGKEPPPIEDEKK
jgi:hypothetical protein